MKKFWGTPGKSWFYSLAIFVASISLLITLLVNVVPSSLAEGNTTQLATPPPTKGDTSGLLEGASAEWLGTVQKSIRLAEYNVTWQNQTYLSDLPAAYQAPNRAHNLRTYFTSLGIRVISRTDANPTWNWACH
jgi:hypothetical protein